MAKEAVEELPVEALLVELRNEMVLLGRKGGRASEQALYEAASTGQELVVIKAFKANSRQYQPGDRIQVNASEEPWLLRQGYVNTLEKYENGARHVRLSKYFRDEVSGIELRYHDANRARGMAEAGVEAAVKALEAARQRLESAQAQKADAERDLRGALRKMQAIKDGGSK